MVALSLGLIIPRGQSVSGHVVFPARSPRMRHRSELTEKAWKNAVQGLGKDQGARNRGSKLRDENPGIGDRGYGIRDQRQNPGINTTLDLMYPQVKIRTSNPKKRQV